jgi:hypothetical protein
LLQAIDQGAVKQRIIEGAMDGVSSGSGSNRRSDGCRERRIREQKKERRMVQAKDQRAIGGATDGASDN